MEYALNYISFPKNKIKVFISLTFSTIEFQCFQFIFPFQILLAIPPPQFYNYKIQFYYILMKYHCVYKYNVIFIFDRNVHCVRKLWVAVHFSALGTISAFELGGAFPKPPAMSFYSSRQNCEIWTKSLNFFQMVINLRLIWSRRIASCHPVGNFTSGKTVIFLNFSCFGGLTHI